MTGTLLTRRAAAKVDIWRRYWSYQWHRLPDWSNERLSALLRCELARQAIKPQQRALSRPPLVSDYPRGTHPFLGVMTLGPDGQASTHAGVLEFPLAGHLLTVAPTRTGKGASHIIPNLLLYAGSTLVIDIKGENYDITAERRRTMFPGARVFRFAPLDDNSSRYNPLDFVRSGTRGGSTPDTFADSRLLADMLLPPKEKENYWDLEARNLLTMLLMYVATRYWRDDPDRTMRNVISLLLPEGEPLSLILELILHWAGTNNEPILSSLASSFKDQDERLLSNVLASTRAGMHVWLSPRLLNATDATDFQFSELKASMCRPLDQTPAPTTVYVVIPPEYLSEYRGVVRMMVGLSIAELIRAPTWLGPDGWRERAPCPVLLLLDELPSLGHMSPIVDGLAYLAGYGVQIWSFAQNIGQLKKIYGDEWQNFPANAGAMSFFGVNDPDTAEYVARQLGETAEYSHYYHTSSTTVSDGTSWTDGGFTTTDNTSHTESQNVRFVKTAIASPADIRALDQDLQLVFIRSTPPILAVKMPYYDFPLFNDLYGSWTGGVRA